MISFPFFKQETFQAPCRVHCLSLLNVECEKSMTGFLCHVWKVYKWHCCIAEVVGHFPWKNCYSDILFVKPWRQEEQMSLTSMRGYLTADLKINLWLYALQLMLDLCQQQEQQAVLCLTCAERRKIYWRNCKLLQEKNGWTLLSYFDSVLEAGKDIKMTESDPCCTFEQISGRNSSTVRRPHWGFSQVIQSKAFQCEKHETAHPFLCKLLAEKNGAPQTGLKHHSASFLSPFWSPLQAVNLFISCWFQVYKQTFSFFSLGN